jgi:Ni/Co efflux regulator RcnB
MKKYLLAAVAASLISVPAVAAPQHRDSHDRGSSYDNSRHDRGSHKGWNKYRTWHRGEHFDYRYARNYRKLDYRHYRGLRSPPRGYHWVRSGDDALLVGITSGVIASIIANAAR